MSSPRPVSVSVSRVLPLCGLWCLLAVGCVERPVPDVDPGPNGGPDTSGTVPTTGVGGAGDGGLVAASDGGLFAPKPTCSGSGGCAGPCPDGGAVCLGNCGFLTPVRYPLSGIQEDMVAGDLQGDGADDLITSDSQGNTISVLLNQQRGLFLLPSLWGANRPTSLALAKVDSDSSLDLLFSNSGTSALGLYRGKGDGTLGAFTFAPVGGGAPRGVTLVENNGVRQAAAIRPDNQDIAAFAVSSAGVLSTPGSFYTSPTTPWTMVSADFNGDGRADLAVAHVQQCPSGGGTTCQSVGVHLGKSDGSFDTQRLTSTGGTPVALLATRVDTDALTDLIVADSSRHQVLVLSGRGDGSFIIQATYPTVRSPTKLALIDINKDTVPDLVVGSQGSDASVLLGQPGGTFAAQVPLLLSNLEAGTRALKSSDFDRDGTPDLAVLMPSGIQMLWGICR